MRVRVCICRCVSSLNSSAGSASHGGGRTSSKQCTTRLWLWCRAVTSQPVQGGRDHMADPRVRPGSDPSPEIYLLKGPLPCPRHVLACQCLSSVCKVLGKSQGLSVVSGLLCMAYLCLGRVVQSHRFLQARKTTVENEWP